MTVMAHLRILLYVFVNFCGLAVNASLEVGPSGLAHMLF